MTEQFDFVNCFEPAQNDAVNYAISSALLKVVPVLGDLQELQLSLNESPESMDLSSVEGEISGLNKTLVDFIDSTNTAISVLEDQIKKVASVAVNSAYPVGATYIQFPSTDGSFDDGKSPSVLYPGTTWRLLFDTESVFFMTEGTKAQEGRSEGLQAESFKSHQHKHQHNHGMANHTHGAGSLKVTLSSSGRTATTPYNKSYAGSSTGVGTGGYKPTVNASGSTGTPSTNATNDNTAQPNTDSTGGSETRPVNRLFRIWERTK